MKLYHHLQYLHGYGNTVYYIVDEGKIIQRTRNGDITYRVNSTISDLANSNIATFEPQSQTIQLTTQTTHKTIGTRTILTEVFKDKLEIKETKTEDYTFDDLKAYLKEKLGKDPVFSSDENTYYTSLENSKQLNRIDFINANKNIVEKYMRKQDIRSEHLGYTRDALFFAYEMLKHSLNEEVSKYPGAIRYGTSLGIEESKVTYNLAGMESLNVAGAIIPFSQSDISTGSLNIDIDGPYRSGSGNPSWGYSGHGGIDLQWSGARSTSTECSDRLQSSGGASIVCVQGPSVYSMVAGKLKYVVYSLYNTYDGRSYGTSTYSTSPAGTHIVITADGIDYWYMHLCPFSEQHYNDLKSKIGQDIPAGTFLGYMGNTGHSSGMHLHAELKSGSQSDGTRSSNTLLFLAATINNGSSSGVDYTNIKWKGIKNGLSSGVNQQIVDLIANNITQ